MLVYVHKNAVVMRSGWTLTDAPRLHPFTCTLYFALLCVLLACILTPVLLMLAFNSACLGDAGKRSCLGQLHTLAHQRGRLRAMPYTCFLNHNNTTEHTQRAVHVLFIALSQTAHASQSLAPSTASYPTT